MATPRIRPKPSVVALHHAILNVNRRGVRMRAPATSRGSARGRGPLHVGWIPPPLGLQRHDWIEPSAFVVQQQT